MLTAAALLEIHRRTHFGTSRLLAHCAQFSPEELARDFGSCGFGYPDLLEQWRHIIGAEDYWLNVLLGNWDIPDHAAACSTVDELEARRVFVEQQTQDFLKAVTDEYLNTPREVACWPNATLREVIPGYAVLRVTTHAFQHRGQIVAMCRLLGQPCAPSDFPLVPQP